MEKIEVKLKGGEKIILALTPDEATALALMGDEGWNNGQYASHHSKQLVKDAIRAREKLDAVIKAYHKELKPKRG